MTRIAMLAGCALALVAIACGGGGGPSETPTPEPTETPSATATPEAVGFLPRPTPEHQLVSAVATVTPMTDVFFHHPAEDLPWGGPGDGVYSQAHGHCSNSELTAEFGVPGLIVENGSAFYLRWAVERQETWRRTGYFYGDWEIWQGDDPLTAYLVHTGEERIAFRYHFEPHCF